MVLPGGDHEIVRLMVLYNEPHCLNIVAGEPPVAFSIQIPQVEAVLHLKLDASHCTGDLPGYKGLSTHGRFVIEKYPIASKETVCFSVVTGYPIPVQFGYGIWASWIERCGFPLRRLLHEAEEFARRGLVKTNLLPQIQDPDSLQQAQRAERI